MDRALNLEVKPSWAEIDRARDACVAFLRQQRFADATVDAVSMVTSELVENANKYGEFSSADAAIRIRLSVTDSAIIVEVRNPVGHCSTENLAQLDRMIQWIRGFQDPFEAYVERLRVVSAQSLHHAESGLGLCELPMRANRSSTSVWRQATTLPSQPSTFCNDQRVCRP